MSDLAKLIAATGVLLMGVSALQIGSIAERNESKLVQFCDDFHALRELGPKGIDAINNFRVKFFQDERGSRNGR